MPRLDIWAYPAFGYAATHVSMLKTRTKQLEGRSALAVHSLEEIKRAIVTLGNEDLLDLADIFRAKPTTAVARMAAAEMTKRGISL